MPRTYCCPTYLSLRAAIAAWQSPESCTFVETLYPGYCCGARFWRLLRFAPLFLGFNRGDNYPDTWGVNTISSGRRTHGISSFFAAFSKYIAQMSVFDLIWPLVMWNSSGREPYLNNTSNNTFIISAPLRSIKRPSLRPLHLCGEK